jgi:hypothetical protein
MASAWHDPHLDALFGGSPALRGLEALILGWVVLRIRAHRGRFYC